ncbi:MAG: gliding motility-associated C-terminal domain-containing protein [Saprospiraceae bacterium]|nr:gliding motility-associated C-terminal domain-containing protein [Saprospiraceae bacterium]
MKKHLLLILALISFSKVWATHNRAGEITYQQIGPLTIRMTITTYTKESSVAADRDSLEVFWGDGLSQWVKRTNDSGQTLENDVKLNKYTAEHTYPGRASYTISFLDPNRSGNILNINYPRSDEIQFYLATRFTLLDIQFQGSNSSAILLQAPIDVACVGQPFVHNPNAYDPDGDSLSYELIVPLSGDNQEVPNYFYPDEILPSSLNLISLNPQTGEFIWEFPPQIGEYNIAMRISEWRNGVRINAIIRDMQILVRNCNTVPPSISALEELCVVAGTEISLPIKVADKDVGQKVKLTATGGPFVLPDKAQLIAPEDFTSVPFEAALLWKTTCNHISGEYYQIVLKAIDNAFGDTFGLATLKTIRIKVVGPAPDQLTAQTAGADEVRLEWGLPYACDQTRDEYFYGFSIWRREQSAVLNPDSCNPGPLTGVYSRILANTKLNDGNHYFFVDKGLKPNTTYCYRVLAEFALKTAAGNPYRKVESLPSAEVCLMLRRDVPLFTKVNVQKTDANTGEMEIRWTRPIPGDFDTIQFKGPYKTELYRKESDSANFQLVPGATKFAPSFSQWLDTTYTDVAINTLERRFDYQLKLYYNLDMFYKDAPVSGSVFLTIQPSDRSNKLSWEYTTSWSNKNFRIFRDDATGTYIEIGQTEGKIFTDGPLENTLNYCYRIESEGSYAIPKIEDPLFNFSQRSCASPMDNIAPCAPELSVSTICDEADLTSQKLANLLTWKRRSNCSNFEDIAAYQVYFKASGQQEAVLLTNHTSALLEFDHLPDSNDISGCYFVTALDKVGNESDPSNTVCVENCPVYELPNTFTPNGDGDNEFFKPLNNYFIHSVDFIVYNEWGNKVFQTMNPALNWNGKNIKGNELPAGSYYYTCSVFVPGTGGLKKEKVLKGFINIIR